MKKSKDSNTPIANINPFGLRMQPELKLRIQEAASHNNRSLNAEIVATLEEKYPAPKASAEQVDGMITHLRQAIEKGPDHIQSAKVTVVEELITKFPDAPDEKLKDYIGALMVLAETAALTGEKPALDPYVHPTRKPASGKKRAVDLD